MNTPSSKKVPCEFLVPCQTNQVSSALKWSFQRTSGPVMAASHSKKFSSVTGPAAIPSGGFLNGTQSRFYLNTVAGVAI